MADSGARSNSARSEAARERVLQAALRALAANGYRGSSLASIAADAGLTNAGLLHHFPSKNELLVAVLVERDRLDHTRFHPPDLRGLAAFDRLQELVEHNTCNPELVRAFTVLLGESVGEEHPARRWAQERYPRLQAELAGALRAGIEDGEVRADVDVDAVAVQVFAMMDGLQVQWVLDPERVDMGALFAAYLDGLRREIRAAPQPSGPADRRATSRSQPPSAVGSTPGTERPAPVREPARPLLEPPCG